MLQAIKRVSLIRRNVSVSPLQYHIHFGLHKNQHKEGRIIGFFGFPVLDIFEIGFCTQNVRFFSFGIDCGFVFSLFLILDFRFLLIEKVVFQFCYSLV